MKNGLILLALDVLLVQCTKTPHYTYFTSPQWWFSNVEFWPLPTALITANENPAGSVSANIGHSLPYVLRSNVSEFVAEPATDENKKSIPNAHAIATTFDLTYTGSAALNASYAGIDGNSSRVKDFWAVAYNYDFSSGVLDAYDPNSPGDCSKPLGAACVQALQQHPIKAFGFDGLKLSVPECSDTLGQLSNDLEGDVTIMSAVNNIWANATNLPFLWLSSGAFSGRDQSALDDGLSKMQLVGITATEEDNSSGAQTQFTSVMCFRVGGKAVQNGAAGVFPGFATRLGVAVLTAIAVTWNVM